MGDEIVFVYVEDDQPSRLIMEMMLDEMGFAYVTVLADSYTFLDTIEALSPAPNVFFLDIHVQPYDGFEMLALLRQHPRFQDALVIALTASVMNEEVARLKTAGFDSIISKPLNQDVFPATLERILSGEKVWRIL